MPMPTLQDALATIASKLPPASPQGQSDAIPMASQAITT